MLANAPCLCGIVVPTATAGVWVCPVLRTSPLLFSVPATKKCDRHCSPVTGDGPHAAHFALGVIRCVVRRNRPDRQKRVSFRCAFRCESYADPSLCVRTSEPTHRGDELRSTTARPVTMPAVACWERDDPDTRPGPTHQRTAAAHRHRSATRSTTGSRPPLDARTVRFEHQPRREPRHQHHAEYVGWSEQTAGRRDW